MYIKSKLTQSSIHKALAQNLGNKENTGYIKAAALQQSKQVHSQSKQFKNLRMFPDQHRRLKALCSSTYRTKVRVQEAGFVIIEDFLRQTDAPDKLLSLLRKYLYS